MATLLSAESDNQQDFLESVIAAPAATADTGTLIVVLGMHRGGTSAINRAMVTMGADLGDHLGTPKAGENDKGFFEDLDIVEINEQILAATHSKWHTLAPVDFSRIDPAKLAALRMRAASVLREKCRNRTFALKDPRLSRLLAFWQPVFDQAQLRVAYVIAVRNPVSVGLSLQKRNGFAPERSYALWLGHMVPALQATHNKLRTVVDYDGLLDSPLDELTRMAGQLGFALNDERVRTFESEFLDRNLQHWRCATHDLAGMRAVPQEVRELFTALVAVSRIDRCANVCDLPIKNP
ncbi:sulfotransferase family protein [Paraburkholderia sp. B3]|uniref:sulfotransferase family protein n=1 Tax=Paraburkholderia sp. B3 TaxID=3134791 RepID=UPI0039825346